MHEHASECLASATKATNHFKYTKFNSGSCSSFVLRLYMLRPFFAPSSIRLVMRTVAYFFSISLKTKILNTRTNSPSEKRNTYKCMNANMANWQSVRASKRETDFNQIESFQWNGGSLAFGRMHRNVYLSSLTLGFGTKLPRLTVCEWSACIAKSLLHDLSGRFLVMARCFTFHSFIYTEMHKQTVDEMKSIRIAWLFHSKCKWSLR